MFSVGFLCEEGRCHMRIPVCGERERGKAGMGVLGGWRAGCVGVLRQVTLSSMTSFCYLGCQLDVIRDFFLPISTEAKFTISALSENLLGLLLTYLQDEVKYSNYFF